MAIQTGVSKPLVFCVRRKARQRTNLSEVIVIATEHQKWPYDDFRCREPGDTIPPARRSLAG